MIAVVVALLLGQVPASGPANPSANARARATLDYLINRPTQAEKRILSGQFTGYGPGAKLDVCEEAFQKSGHWPAIIGLDYADYSDGQHRLHTKKVNRLAIDYARRGGLVTISAHLPNPAKPNGGLRDKGVELAKLLDPADPVHQRWLEELDIMADGLTELRDAGVVVLWRPFHEMNGNWFWWGGKDPATFQKLWIQMFDYFTTTRKLDNLLWVYSPNHGDKVVAYYPGDHYVDIVGLDAYTDFVDSKHIKGYKELAALLKPFGFTEFGPHGPDKPPGDFVYTRLLAGIEKEFPKTSFFLAWDDKWALSKNLKMKELLDNPAIVNLDALPKTIQAGP